MALKTYTIYRTATLRQFKEVRCPHNAMDHEIIESGETVPWKTAKTINSEAPEVE